MMTKSQGPVSGIPGERPGRACSTGGVEVVYEWIPIAAMLALGWRWATRFEDRVDWRLGRIEGVLATHGERIAHIEGLLQGRNAAGRSE